MIVRVRLAVCVVLWMVFWPLQVAWATKVTQEILARETLQKELAGSSLETSPPLGWASIPDASGFQPLGGPSLTAYRQYLVERGWDCPKIWHTAGFLTSGNLRLGVNVFVPPGTAQGVFLFVHGYQSHSAAFGAFLAAFAKRGWIVVTLDLPGHGISEGTRSDIGDFVEYGDAVADWLRWVWSQTDWPEVRVLAAHSLGTAACLEALRRPTTPVPTRVWFFAPLLRTAWFPLLTWTQDVFGWALKDVGSPFGSDGYLDGERTPLHWFQALRVWLTRLDQQKPLLLPLTVWSGDQDTVVDADWNRRAYQRLVPAAEYRVFPGRDHLFLTKPTERVAVFAEVVRELDRIRQGFRIPRPDSVTQESHGVLAQSSWGSLLSAASWNQEGQQ